MHSPKHSSERPEVRPGVRPPMPSRMRPDTRKILLTGSSILGAGLLAVLLTYAFFGGIGHQGPHTNSGWLCLMLAMGCLPTGLLTLLLGLAKLSGDRSR